MEESPAMIERKIRNRFRTLHRFRDKGYNIVIAGLRPTDNPNGGVDPETGKYRGSYGHELGADLAQQQWRHCGFNQETWLLIQSVLDEEVTNLYARGNVWIGRVGSTRPGRTIL
jgi:hypothetical protein